ncbi:Hypothetical protein BSPT2_I0146 [Brucella suis bv. 2]|nr:Hypothetical protein BSPT2_I0146 [Brucella suis bv. 2]
MALFCASGAHVPRAVPVLTETPELLYLFVLSHYPAQNRFTLLLEML